MSEREKQDIGICQTIDDQNPFIDIVGNPNDRDHSHDADKVPA